MGLFSFFKDRRAKESAVPPSQSLGSFANPEGREVVGRQVGAGSAEIQSIPGTTGGLAALAQLGPMIQRAIAEGNVQIEQGGSQTIDTRGTGLREEILGVMKAHGIDAESGSARNVDAAAYGDMQRQLLAALARHGIDPGASGTSLDFRIESKDD
ncbi:MAG: hypothetical protein ACRDLO_12410 [Solirubrobacterales bacterium]